MLVLALILLSVFIVFSLLIYILLAVGVIPLDNYSNLYQLVVGYLKAFVLRGARAPMEMQVAAVAFFAVGHQIMMTLAPPAMMLFSMGNWADEYMLSNGLSQKIDLMIEFIRSRWWLKLIMLPFSIWAMLFTFVVVACIDIIFDPHVSSTILCCVCFPIATSLAAWYAEETFVPLEIRRDWLGTVTSGEEVPDAGSKRKVNVVAGATVAAVSTSVIALYLYKPVVLDVLLGRKIDPFMYLIGVTAAVSMAAGMAAIQFDGQTKQISAQKGAKDWDANSTRDYYHKLLAITCIIVAVAFVAFPFFNNPYFSYRRLVSSVA